jgi:hypothetical protein
MRMKGMVLLANGTLEKAASIVIVNIDVIAVVETGTANRMRTRFGHDWVVDCAHGTVTATADYVRKGQ